MSERSTELKNLLRERVLVLDGAMGTGIQDLELTAEDFGGVELEGCNENLVLTRPDAIRDIHRRYLEVGADIIETDTFGGTPLVLAEYGLEAKTHDINKRAAEIAREAAAEFTTPERPRFVAGSIGPTTKTLTVTGGITFPEMRDTFHAQVLGLLDGGVDVLLVETCQDTRNIKAALLAIESAMNETGIRVPIMVSGTIEPTGTMLAGQGVEALYTSLMHVDLLSIGLNCATGPEFMTDHLRALADLAACAVTCVPNAGLPDTDGNYLETPESMTHVIERFLDAGWLNMIGGCCGTTPAHVQAMVELAAAKKPRQPVVAERSLVSGIDFLELTDDNRPVLVGERTNVIGSRKFKRLITEEKFEEASEIARRQVKGGAQVIDVCLANPDRNELEDMSEFLGHLIRKVKAPLMIDSTDAHVIAESLTYSQGKAIINSINLEDGEERFEEVVPVGRRFGAAFVVGTIDEDPESGMAVTRERKLEIATRSYELLTQKYGVPGTDIVWDPLTFPCATGDEKYVGSAVETIEGIRLIKEAFPDTRSILGISNVSFGLPNAGREVLNSVFLYHCTKAGLDMAIVNTEKLERYASIPEEERKLSEDLLWNRGDDPVAAFAAHFRDATSRTKRDTSTLSLDERLANYIVEGTKEGLVADLDRKREEATPLEIINGPLMTGMDEVGRLFNDNELIVAEVLESAEAMKAAVAHLEQFMEKSESSSRGTLMLATVKGDVHDIGKNLVEIVVGNNGYEIINLGIKVPPEVLIRKVREHQPDVLGLSGLLVKSAQMMVVSAEDLREAGVDIPILVGGAALTRKFCRTRIAPRYDGAIVYAKDAMDGLDLLNQLMSADDRPALLAKLEAEAADFAQPTNGTKAPASRTTAPAPSRAPSVRLDVPVPAPPDTQRHRIDISGKQLDDVWRFVNPFMLYGRHLGLKGDFEKLHAAGDPKALALAESVERVKQECRDGAMQAAAVWRFFGAEADGDAIQLFDDAGRPVQRFTMPRQNGREHLCLADYVMPKGDHVALVVTTAGSGIRQLAEQAKEAGEYVRSHVLQALALETAEATAEWIHCKLRGLWGFPDPPELTMKRRFKADYRGKRYSFGYPACPDLAGQEGLFALMQPQDIGVTLTDGFMMEPEASVSALVFHHPDATYFSLGADAEPELAGTGMG